MHRKIKGILQILVGKDRGSRNTQTRKGKQGGLKRRSKINCSRGKTKDRSENSSGGNKANMQKEGNQRHIERVYREKEGGGIYGEEIIREAKRQNTTRQKNLIAGNQKRGKPEQRKKTFANRT